MDGNQQISVFEDSPSVSRFHVSFGVGTRTKNLGQSVSRWIAMIDCLRIVARVPSIAARQVLDCLPIGE